MDIREIARCAGVSHSTVSRVLNKSPTVNPSLAKRVQAVIDQSGYHPNYQARALACGRSHTVGLIVSEFGEGSPFSAGIVLHFQRAAVLHGFEVLISFADLNTNPNDVEICVERMKERRVEGIAVLTFGMEEALAETVSAAVPVVHAGGPLRVGGLRAIRVDYASGLRDAVNHLLEFGHTQIGYLSGQLGWSSMKMRFEALRKVMRLAGNPLDMRLVVECDHTLEGGVDGMAKMLALPCPPTAVLCCNDMAAFGALKTLHTRSVKVGRQMSLIGFDDLLLASFTFPALSTVRFSPHELANLAFRALMEEIREDTNKPQYEYKTRFVLRHSTGPPGRFGSR